MGQEGEAPKNIHSLRPSSLIAPVLFLLVLSLALTQGHDLFSLRYPAKSMSQLKDEYENGTNSLLSISRSELDDFLETEGAVIAYGQALHPSFRTADEEGLDDTWPVYTFWPSYKPRPFSRVLFNLIGPISAGVVLPMKSPPASFPESAEVIVVGCLAETGEIYALAVLIEGPSPTHYLSEPFPALACPFTGPK